MCLHASIMGDVMKVQPRGHIEGHGNTEVNEWTVIDNVLRLSRAWQTQLTVAQRCVVHLPVQIGLPPVSQYRWRRGRDSTRQSQGGPGNKRKRKSAYSLLPPEWWKSDATVTNSVSRVFYMAAIISMWHLHVCTCVLQNLSMCLRHFLCLFVFFCVCTCWFLCDLVRGMDFLEDFKLFISSLLLSFLKVNWCTI